MSFLTGLLAWNQLLDLVVVITIIIIHYFFFVLPLYLLPISAEQITTNLVAFHNIHLLSHISVKSGVWAGLLGVRNLQGCNEGMSQG